MKRILATVAWGISGSLGATASLASPVCQEFRAPDLMPKKYAKLAPVLSNGADGWLITNDQMDLDYTPHAEVPDLLRSIAEEFARREMPLAIMIPPPRPLVAGQKVMDDFPNGAEMDVAEVSASFSAMISDIRSAGLIAPDLLLATQGKEALPAEFYFRRDTHWTPAGAAVSALALADEVALTLPRLFPKAGSTDVTDLTLSETVTEKGSLNGMAKNVCGVILPPETAPTLRFPQEEGGLLDEADNSKPRVALAGSSFSDRYQRDFYQVADALAHALGAEVDNYSVSGGGAIGGLESLVLSGALTSGHYDLVVWELPYTESLSRTHFLRQLLGALRHEELGTPVATVGIDPQAKDMTVTPHDGTPGAVLVSLPESDLQRVAIDLRLADGSKETLQLLRKDKVPAERRSDLWAVSLDGYDRKGIQQMKLRFKGGKPGQDATVSLYK
ncbi:hypothetical protein J7382_04175 [Shimia sp. R11_0]|uniref:alginate O-acetyltransferase AlgX-related protein n=1 Tax=Shimia sp. R11_0 TaxID=2821096 RepID=UPI001ADA36BB|nr:hypothetical protein [Shimia sp. R11_0]MBO9476726.1 hypothetical protein [Shimia sp. R11_0]